MTITAIPTRYAGHHFRSRLEARWAVFFDTLGVAWEYEPEGFDTTAGRYLPDFLIRATPRHPDIWIEIKAPTPLPHRDRDRVYAFATGMMGQCAEVGVICLRGVPPGDNAFLFHKSAALGERLGEMPPAKLLRMLFRPGSVTIEQATTAALSARFDGK